MWGEGAPLLEETPLVLTPAGWADYGLVDSGGGRKLERFGRLLLDRPEPQCLWPRASPEAWDEAAGVFEPASEEADQGRWRLAPGAVPASPVRWRSLVLQARLTRLRHVGLFPEQAPVWAWLADEAGPGRRLLNLFGYTGAASLAAAAAGAEVTHVDASRPAVAWAKENAAASGLGEAPIRWLVEDARAWVRRELRRGARYHGVLLDPPKHGRGPAGEVWRLLDDLPELLAGCAALLAGEGRFLWLNAYAERVSAVSLASLLRQQMAGRGGRIAFGELALQDAAEGRRVGLSVFSRWTAA